MSLKENHTDYNDLTILIERLARVTERLENTISNFDHYRVEHKEEIEEIKARLTILESHHFSKQYLFGGFTLIANWIVIIIGLFLEWRMGNK